MENALTILPPASLTTHGIQITGQAMTFPEDLPYEAWADMDKQFERAEMGLGWWRGDWYNFGEDNYEGFAQVLEVNEAKKRTCINNGSVCKRYTPEQRAKTGHLLSFSHHAAAAYVDEPLRSELLWLAIGNKWSCHDLREEIKRLAEKGEEHEAQQDQNAGKQVNEEYIAVSLPLTVQSVGALIDGHLDASDEVSLRDWLTERIGDGDALSVSVPAQETPDEPWNIHSARLIREAIEEAEAEAYAELPASYLQAARRLANWIESQDRLEGEE